MKTDKFVCPECKKPITPVRLDDAHQVAQLVVDTVKDSVLDSVVDMVKDSLPTAVVDIRCDDGTMPLLTQQEIDGGLYKVQR